MLLAASQSAKPDYRNRQRAPGNDPAREVPVCAQTLSEATVAYQAEGGMANGRMAAN